MAINWDAEIRKRTERTRLATVAMFERLEENISMTEHDMTAALLRSLRSKYPGAWVHKVNERIQGGVPDIEFIVNGVALKIECKGPKTEVTELQLATMQKLSRAGQKVLLLRFTGHGIKHELSLFNRHEYNGSFYDLQMDLFSYIEQTCR